MRDYRISRAQEMWLPLGLAAMFVIVATVALVRPMHPHGLWEHSVPWLVMSFGAPFVCYAGFYRLQWSPGEFLTKWGPLKWRGVHLDCLISLDVGSAGTAVWIEAIDAHGCRMRLNQTVGWTDQGEWGPLLVQAARSCGAQVGNKAESYLVKTPSQRRWGTPTHEGQGRHEPRQD